MGFLLSAAIFITSTGFLVNAERAPTPPPAIESASTSGSSEAVELTSATMAPSCSE
jgi:hypothetical protein